MHCHHLFFGRGRGPHGFGHFGRGFMDWDFGGRGFGMGRKLGSADLQLMILKLLDDRPSYGYEIIKELERRTQGYYVPSPGVVYPAMTYLEEIGHATVEIDGARKLYVISDAGKRHLADNSATVEALFSQFARVGERMDQLRRAYAAYQDGEAPDFDRRTLKELKYARHALRSALAEKWNSSKEEQQRIADILKRAAEEIKGS